MASTSISTFVPTAEVLADMLSSGSDVLVCKMRDRLAHFSDRAFLPALSVQLVLDGITATVRTNADTTNRNDTLDRGATQAAQRQIPNQRTRRESGHHRLRAAEGSREERVSHARDRGEVGRSFVHEFWRSDVALLFLRSLVSLRGSPAALGIDWSRAVNARLLLEFDAAIVARCASASRRVPYQQPELDYQIDQRGANIVHQQKTATP